MNPSRTLTLAGTSVMLAAAALTGVATSASAVDNDSATSCSREERVSLRQEILDLHTQIAALRLTPQQIADARAAHRKAVDELRAEYGLPGATLTDEQRAALKADLAALRADEREATAERRAKIDPLKSQILADRSELAACRAAANSTAS